jgi:hypothetical protein
MLDADAGRHGLQKLAITCSDQGKDRLTTSLEQQFCSSSNCLALQVWVCNLPVVLLQL